MDAPPSADVVPLHAALRGAGLALLGAAAASTLLALALDHAGVAWAAWAAGAYVSWAVALTILRRRLADAAWRLRPRRRQALRLVLLLAALVAAAAAGGATHVLTGILCAAATLALVTPRGLGRPRAAGRPAAEPASGARKGATR